MIVLVVIVLLSIVLLANVGLREAWARTSARLLLLVLNGCVALLGLWALVGASRILPQVPNLPATMGEMMPAVRGLGVVSLGAALLGSLLLVGPVRRQVIAGLARNVAGGLDVASPVHTVALVFGVYLVAWMALLLLLPGGILALAQSSGPVLLGDVLLSGVVTVAFALMGVGLGVRRTWRATLSRLGLERLSLRSVLEGMLGAAALLAFLWTFGAVWLWLAPDSLNSVDSATEVLFAGFDSLPVALMVALSSAVGEEVLFRGALQPRLGLIPTTLLFALLHVQYSFSPAWLVILGVGVGLGLLRLWRDTTTSIVAHFTYNFVLLGLSVALPDL